MGICLFARSRVLGAARARQSSVVEGIREGWQSKKFWKSEMLPRHLASRWSFLKSEGVVNCVNVARLSVMASIQVVSINTYLMPNASA
jgi:hypothetical protein